METNKLIPYSVYLPYDLHKKLKSLAKDRKASELIRNAIQMIIEGNTAYNSGYNKALKDTIKVINTNESAVSISVHGILIADNLISDIKASVELADLVLIDGGPRTLVAKIVSEALGSSKLIVLDNSDRVHERDAVSVLQQQGYVEIPFSGLGPLNPYCWTTSFFVREISTLRNLLYPE